MIQDQKMKDLYARTRELTKKYSFTIITPKAPPGVGRSVTVSNEGPVIIDYIGLLTRS